MRKSVACVVSGLLAAAVSFQFAQARPITPAEKRYMPYYDVKPQCDDPGPLQRITSRFHQRETEFWQSGLEIVGYDKVREIGDRTTGLDYIPRRYCAGRAAFNDGKFRDVFYWIGEGTSMVGFDWGIEWCVVGLDRHNADAPNCKMARP